MFTAIDIAILPPDPVKSLAIELSKKLSPNFHLNETDILPHLTLGIGFVEEFQISNVKYQITNIVGKFRPIEVMVERAEGRYLMCRKTEGLYSLHKSICDAVGFLQIQERILRKAQDSFLNSAYVGKVDAQTIDFTNNFKWRNAYDKWVPHITVGWDDEKVISDEWLVAEGEPRQGRRGSQLPIKFTAEKISICQLGNKNTCRKVLAEFYLKQG